MSGVTHSQIPIKQPLLRDQRRAKIIALVAVTIFTALLVALILVLAGDDSPTSGTEASAPQPTHQPSDPQVGPSPPRPASRQTCGPARATTVAPRKATAAPISSPLRRRNPRAGPPAIYTT
jgi:hypothetical protein